MKTKMITLKTKHFARIFVLMLIVTLVCAAPAGATPGASTPVPAAPHALGDPQELEEFWDGLMTQQLAEEHVAGAVVVVVKDGQVLLSKGYGYADVEQQIPVDAEQTLFRPGSVTKLFTWTAVMQLVEQGKIDLNADVNTYLTRFKVPATYPQPITMLDLMAHTAGFEELSGGQGKKPPEELTSLEDLLIEYMPARAFPPGQAPAYSNYGATLAGYIVEQVSGEPYEQYVETHILKPLGMDHSTMHEPLPAELALNMSQGYKFDGTYQSRPFSRSYITPAGALSASGADMGKFMLAHLQDGEYNGGRPAAGRRILKPETARQMHTQSYTFDPALTGSAHGFQESTLNGRRLIGHDGDMGMSGFRTMLRLIPEEGVGIYVSFNTVDVGESRAILLQAFMDRYFPATATTGEADKRMVGSGQPDDRLSRYTGVYVTSRHVFSTPEKLQALSEMTWIASGPDGTLRFPHLLNPLVTESWVYVRPLVFQNTRSGELAVFHEDERGQVRYLAVANEPSRILIKQPWYGYLGLLVFGLLIFLLTIIAAPVGFFVSFKKRGSGGRAPWQGRLARGMALALCVMFFAFVVITYVNWLDKDIPVIRILAWVIAVLALGVTFLAAAVWWKGWWGLAGRLHYTIIALAGLAVTWFLVYWRLLVLP